MFGQEAQTPLRTAANFQITSSLSDVTRTVLDRAEGYGGEPSGSEGKKAARGKDEVIDTIQRKT